MNWACVWSHLNIFLRCCRELISSSKLLCTWVVTALFDTELGVLLAHLCIASLFQSLPAVNCFQYVSFFFLFHNLGIILNANDIIGMAVYI